ncbi:hypothetical protein [Chlorogloea sp. CCALA 695]|uniref:hypothetical protein n=1 Tax=Chlorogloea sp. CCALA 695 TaxID=2107693 RepID=UPI0011B2453F
MRVGQSRTCQLHILCLLAPAHKALFRWLELTTVQVHLHLRYSLVLLLDGYRIRLPVEPPFLPASGFDG